MEAALKEKVVPVLRARGFTGSLPHFRRILEDRVDLLTVQFDRHGGGFVVEISRCDPGGVTTAWGKHIPAAKARAHDLHPDERHRLGSPRPGMDGRWFRFEGAMAAATAARSVLGHLEEAETWWASAAPLVSPRR
jgi:hypothetical protein